jgi:hypothetical protein
VKVQCPHLPPHPLQLEISGYDLKLTNQAIEVHVYLESFYDVINYGREGEKVH